MGLCFLWASKFVLFHLYILFPDITVPQICVQTSFPSRFSLIVSFRKEFHLWFQSMFHGGWCTTLSTANSHPRSRQNTTWTNAISTSWPKRSLTSRIITATSATWWFPGRSLIRSAQGLCFLTHIYNVWLEVYLHMVNGSCRRFFLVVCSLFGSGLREWWSWPRSTWGPTGARSEEYSLPSSNKAPNSVVISGHLHRLAFPGWYLVSLGSSTYTWFSKTNPTEHSCFASVTPRSEASPLPTCLRLTVSFDAADVVEIVYEVVLEQDRCQRCWGTDACSSSDILFS